MTKTVQNQKIDTVFVLIVFCVFAVSVLMVLMLGANTYKSITEMSREGQDDSTVLSYIWSKVKNGDTAGNVYVSDFHGQPALCIDEQYGQTLYQTVVYYYNGWVYELFSEPWLNLPPEGGAQIIRADDLSFETLNHGLIKISSGPKSLLISPRANISGVDN